MRIKSTPKGQNEHKRITIAYKAFAAKHGIPAGMKARRKRGKV